MTENTDRVGEIYTAIDTFQRTHRLPCLQHAQIRGLLAEHLARVLPAAVAVRVPDTDRTPSRRAGLRDEIVKALGRIKTIPPVAHRREQADHVLAVLYREWPWLRAEAEDAAPATDRPALRDAIRRAVCEAEGFGWDTDMLEPDEYGEVADAVLAVLPAPADRAAEWNAAAEFVEAMNEGCGRKPCDACTTREDIADALRDAARRMAAVPAAVSGRTDNETGATPVAASGPRANAAASAVGGAQPKGAGA